jgi:adenylate cyclase
MQQAVAALNQDFAARGLNAIDIGVGIHSDRVVVGNMGSRTRLNYTAIGDGVNLASRLEGLTKYYGVALVASAQTAAATSGLQWLELDRVRVKGKQEAVCILEALPADSSAELLQAAAAFQHFLAAWYAGDFVTARERLAANTVLASCRPGLVQLYEKRLQPLLAQAPQHWDGIHTFDAK